MQRRQIITLITDFGIIDTYVGQLKGAILSRYDAATIVDITHSIPAQDIHTAAQALQSSYQSFPPGTIHLVVVDPGVGGHRHILAATGQGHHFIAPDNGILSYLMTDAAIDVVYRVEKPSLFAESISPTFHGRDIMAPVVGAIAAGLALDEVGPAVALTECMQLPLPRTQVKEDRVEGVVVYIDHFGNLRTTITRADLAGFSKDNAATVLVQGQSINQIFLTYAEASPGTLVALFDSSGFLEIAVVNGNAANILGCKMGDPVKVSFGG